MSGLFDERSDLCAMSDLRVAIMWVKSELSYDTALGLNLAEPARLVLEAARKWADLQDQQPIWWCAEHEITGHEPVKGYAFCLTAVTVMSDGARVVQRCRMVKVRLVEVDE